MIYTFRNCKNINDGSITIEPGKLNIRYGANGTGKSAISLAIQSLENEELRVNLVPYSDVNLIPEVNLDVDTPRSIKVFNEQYINTYLFKETDVLDGERVYEVLIKDEDLENKREDLLQLFGELKEKVSLDSVTILVSKLEELHNDLQLNNQNTRFTGTSKAFKALKDGNHFISENIPVILENYIPLLAGTNRIKWIDWFSKGHNFSDKCPYCRSPLPENFQEIKTIISDRFKKADVQNATKFLDNLQSNVDCLTGNGIDLTVDKFTNSNEFAADDAEIVNIFAKLYMLLSVLKILRNISVFDLLDEENTESLLQNFLNTKNEVLPILNENVQQHLEEIGACVVNIQGQRTDYLRQKGYFNSQLRNRVRDSQQQINEFMLSAGIPYVVEIINANTNKPQVILRHISNNQVNNIMEGLSYGERNAFALMMFVMDVSSENTELIILDDPISSFDENKKYAILHSMFIKHQMNSLRNRTVLMLTHDFTSIIDFVRIKNYSFVDARYIRTVEGNLREYAITKDDIKSVIKVAEDSYKDLEKTKVCRVINYRRFLELTNNIDLKYDMISSMLKLKTIPQKKIYDNFEDFSENEKTNINNQIREMFEGFDYDSFIEEFNNKVNLLEAYDSGTNYERVNLIRMLCVCVGDNLRDDVIRKFIYESYHIENTMTFQLDPNAFDNIPSYIIAACDEYADSKR